MYAFCILIIAIDIFVEELVLQMKQCDTRPARLDVLAICLQSINLYLVERMEVRFSHMLIITFYIRKCTISICMMMYYIKEQSCAHFSLNLRSFFLGCHSPRQEYAIGRCACHN